MKRHLCVVCLAICAAVLAGLVLTGCGGSAPKTGGTAPATAPTTGGTGAGGTTITEQGFAFNPSSATVKVGDTVTFANNDSAAHNVKIDGQELGVQNQGESKTWTATKDGSYPFSCVIHPSMTGQITVGSGSGSAPAPTGGTGGAGTPPGGTGGY